MRVAIIDLGTNSVRFDVHSLSEGGKAKLLYREKMMVRLGQGVFSSGRIAPEAGARALKALVRFRGIAARLKAKRIVAFGTSALREAANARAFLGTVRLLTGIRIRVISGSEEAGFIARGVLANEALPEDRFALVDIGGGSTEISLCLGTELLSAGSFPLGTARLQQLFLGSMPPAAQDLRRARAHVRAELQRKWPRCAIVVGSSGTVRALSRILARKRSRGFTVAELRALVKRMEGMSVAQLMRIPRMDARRSGMILGGALLLEEVALALGARRIVATKYSLRDGILAEESRSRVRKK